MMNRTDRDALALAIEIARKENAGRAEQMMKATREMTGLKDWARIKKRDAHAIYLASRDVYAFLAPIIKRDVHAIYLTSRDVYAFLASRDPGWYANVLAIVVIWIAAITIVAASIALAYRYFAA
jgi:hypothetical protein